MSIPETQDYFMDMPDDTALLDFVDDPAGLVPQDESSDAMDTSTMTENQPNEAVQVPFWSLPLPAMVSHTPFLYD